MNTGQLKGITNQQLMRKIRSAEVMRPNIRRATGMTSDRISVMYSEVQRRMLAGTMSSTYPAEFELEAEMIKATSPHNKE